MSLVGPVGEQLLRGALCADADVLIDAAANHPPSLRLKGLRGQCPDALIGTSDNVGAVLVEQHDVYLSVVSASMQQQRRTRDEIV
ncbi:hypothetical protein [Brachybacterium sp. P6-10-X1]|uniref:hypothetical protein n=1 Tax=Brachybacterium sp. P6-10-X1 TaxID=1903186 RepID=UPI001C12BEB1|nr:hypothetical protein [Brachybacterium sp. P6-10-X1]